MRAHLLIVPFLLASFLQAQTEVRHALVLPSYKDLKFAPLPPVTPPVPVEFTLSNGMKVMLLENHELPLVSGSVLVRTGNLFDAAGKHGTAELTGEVLRTGGTRARTGDQVNEDLENIAASVESHMGESSASITFSCLKENTATVLQTFKEFLTSAEFRADKVELVKTQYRSAISRRNDDASGVAEREFERIVYGRDTPYGSEIEYADIDNIQRQDLIDFYHRYYFPANMLLEVIGDFSAPEMKTQLETLLGSWKYTQPPVPQFPKVEQGPAPGLFLATKTDVTQTFFNVGHLGGELRDADYPALEVASQILGGGFSSRLFQRVRTKLGYAYDISANWGANYDHPGTFEISGSTQSAHTVDALRAVREELDRIRTAEVTDEELNIAKDTVLNGFVFFFDRPSKTLNRLATYEYYNYPRDFIFQYQKAIAKVTKGDILRVAKKYFKPQELTYVAVGNPQEFGKPLSDLGMKVQVLDLTIPEPKKESSAPSDAATLEKGKQLLQRVQQALGGAGKLAAIRDLQYQADVDVQGPGDQTMNVKQTTAFLEPSMLRQDIVLPFGKQSVYSDGKTGWIASVQGVQNLPAQVLQQVRGEMFRHLVGLVMSDHDSNRTVSFAGSGKLEIASKDGESAQLFVDEKTGLLSKIAYSQPGGGAVEQAYSDWREVNGIRLPFQWAVVQGGKPFASVKVQEYKLNSGLTQEALSKKP